MPFQSNGRAFLCVVPHPFISKFRHLEELRNFHAKYTTDTLSVIWLLLGGHKTRHTTHAA